MKNPNNRNITLSTKVTAEQKAEFAKIAAKHNITLSEWSASLLEIHKDSYDKVGDPTERENALEMEIQKKEREIKRLKAHLESADHKAQIEMKRADNAITRRDIEVLKCKKIEHDNLELKTELEKKREMERKNIDLENKDENKTLLLPAVLLSGFIGLALGKS
jgi:predicted RNase H-like nuclease (RuvC/YqgF family)